MQANKKNPFLALLPISFSFTRKPHIFSPFSSLKSLNGSCSLYVLFIKARSNAGWEHPVTQFKREMNYIVAWMSRKAFIIGHGLFRLRMKTYLWSSLNYLGSEEESQERYLQEPSRSIFNRLCRNMNFTSSADRRVTILPVLTKISYLYVMLSHLRFIQTFLHPGREKVSLLTTDGSQTRQLYPRNWK